MTRFVLVGLGLAVSVTINPVAQGQVATQDHQDGHNRDHHKPNNSFSYRAYLRPGSDAFPVRVAGAIGEAQQLRISGVAIENRSAKTVSEVRLVWFLTRRREPNRVLATAITPAVSQLNVGPGQKHLHELKGMTFADHHQRFVESGLHQNGPYSVEVAVIEVRYNDGTTWKAEGLSPLIPRFRTDASFVGRLADLEGRADTEAHQQANR